MNDASGSSTAGGGAGALAIFDWFMPASCRQSDVLLPRAQVFITAFLISAPVLALGAVTVDLLSPPGFSMLRDIMVASLAFALLPFALKWSGRLDIVATLGAQAIVGMALLFAYYSGGPISPGMPWLVLGYGTSIYYLASWPRLRAVNVAIQTAALVLFLALALLRPLPEPEVGAQTMLIFWAGSAISLYVLYQIILLVVVGQIRGARHRLRSEIAERERIAAELRVTGDRLHAALEIAGFGIFEHDHDLGTSYWSPELRTILGVAPDAPISLEMHRGLIHPEDRDRVVAALQRRLDPHGDGLYVVDYRVVRPDGKMIWVAARSQTIFEGEGERRRPVRTIGAALDITVRKRIEEQLRASQDHFARAQRAGRIGSVDVDMRAGAVSTWSDEFYRLLGLEPGSVAPGFDNFLAFVHLDDRAGVTERRRRAEQGALDAASEFRVVRPDGKIVWMLWQAEVIRGEDGQVARLVLTFLDITERKRIEEERSILERQLSHSQKLDALGQLAGGVAHDFNNLLAVILGWLALAADELEDRPEVREWVLAAKKAAERGASLTNTMLTFAREQPLQSMEVDPSAVVCELVEMLRRTLGETIVINASHASDQWRCRADPGQLQNALLNLALNARDAMPKGGAVTIHTSNAHLEPAEAGRILGGRPGDFVVVAVSDTGEGMSPEVAARAFEPFFTTKDAGRGTGLGLSMVDGFARHSGGFATIDSGEGRGSTISIYLPALRERTQADAPRVERPDRPSPPATILLIEDYDDLRKLAQLQIERLGYRVLAAADAAQGLATLGEHPETRLLLSDVVLPGDMDGIEAATRAKAIRPDLKVLFMSGYTEHSSLPDLGAENTPRMLRKPFDVAELAAAIRAALEGE
jgi:PAS domain S-box-containing protein